MEVDVPVVVVSAIIIHLALHLIYTPVLEVDFDVHLVSQCVLLTLAPSETVTLLEQCKFYNFFYFYLIRENRVQGYIINDLFTIGNFPAARVPVGFISSVSGGSFETVFLNE